MEYRQLPHDTERLGVVGLGMGGLDKDLTAAQIEQLIRRTIDGGA